MPHIIDQLIPVASIQLEEEVDKYWIETQLRWRSDHVVSIGHPEWTDLMPDFLMRWAVPDEGIFTINCSHHDLHTSARGFDSMDELEEEYKSRDGWFSMFNTWCAPIIDGTVYEPVMKAEDGVLHRRTGDFPSLGKGDLSRWNLELKPTSPNKRMESNG